MSGEGALPPCDQFTVVASRPSERLTRCDVCDQAEEVHPSPGRRTLTGAEIEELRRRMLIERFDEQEQQRHQKEGNGEVIGEVDTSTFPESSE